MKYPILILSKGRHEKVVTADLLDSFNVPYKIFVRQNERDLYSQKYKEANLVSLPLDVDDLAKTRTYIKQWAREQGYDKHWQVDDNIRHFLAYEKGKRVRKAPDYVLSQCENFIDRYTNIANAGLQNTAFGFNIKKPFKTNIQVYCCMLIDNHTPFKFRGGNLGAEDIDYSLQCLSAGYCTILFCAFQIDKMNSGKMKGGLHDEYKDDGRIKRIRWLQNKWPYTVKARRRWDRPTHDLDRVWQRFTQPLIKKQET